MSATAHRAIRRDIRRAVGAEALEIIDRQGRAIEVLAGRITTQEATYANLLLKHQQASAADLAAFRNRSLWQRLGWLVLGR